ncbi:MAG: 8-oxo-dGTP diphosphatase MutT [Rhodospirillaceae bacterium]|nr:8-oxo-dGTP diphosphatase MutT [Rhodospirillaceae bacterium]
MTVKKPVVLVVAVALINTERQVLLAQRPMGKSMAGLWEFPGGKVEDHETPEQALVRELHEELGIDIAVDDLQPLAFASHSYDDFHLLMPLFDCTRWQGEINAKEGQTLAWVLGDDLGNYDMPPADVPLLPALRRVLG